MTREEAIEIINCYDIGFCDLSGEKIPADKLVEAFDMAIEALEGVCFDEWCTDCKEYDTEKKCCPRFNRVIRGAMKRIPHDDGTLEVKVEDATKIGRVLISDDKHRGGLYYPDEDEPQSVSFENDTEIKSCSKDSDLISRAEAIEAIELVDWYHQNRNKDMVHGANSDEHQAWYKADDVYKALEAVPSADKQRNGDLISRAEAIRAITEYNEMPTENCYHEYNHGYKNGMNMAVHFLENIPSADRPRGEWVEQEDDYHHYWECSECGMGVGLDDIRNFCPNCGADMRGDTKWQQHEN